MTIARTTEVGGFWLAASLAALTAMSALGQARASEIFVCEDQSVIYVNSKNRAAMADHPCVKGWFERNRGVVRKPVAAASAATEPAVAAAPAAADASAGDGGTGDAAAKPADTAAPAAAATSGDDSKTPAVTKAGTRHRSF